MATEIDSANAQVSMEKILKQVNEWIKEEGDPGKSGDRTRKILKHLKLGLAFADAVAGVNEYAAAAVKTFAVLVDNELTRRKNREEFVAVYQIFASTLFLVQYLGKVELEAITGKLDECFKDLNDQMKDFGALCLVYYKKYQHAFKQVRDIGERITTLLVAHTTAVTIKTQIDVKHILSIVSKLSKASTKLEMKADKIIKEAGGKALEDDKIANIAEAFGERPTSQTKSLLNQNLQDLLDANRQEFIKKLDEATGTITAKIEQAQVEIIRKLNAGPHNLIEIEEFRIIWKGNGWKSSVKCKQFVDDHPAIADAIDDDSSGYISVREFNHFLHQKPKDWSFPELFAFWALGWQDCAYDTSQSINHLVRRITRIALQTKVMKDKKEPMEPAMTEYIEAYLELLNAITEITRWSQITGYDRSFAADMEHDEDEMDRLTEEYNTYNKEIFDHVMGDDGNIDTEDEWDFNLKQRFGSRVELWFFPLVLQVLKHQLSKISLEPVSDNDEDSNDEDSDLNEDSDEENSDEEDGEEKIIGYQDYDAEEGSTIGSSGNIGAATPQAKLDDYQWDEMSNILECLLYEFHSRMKIMLRGWRVHKLDIELQANSFCGGIFAGWFKGYNDGSNKKIIARLELLDEDDDFDPEFDSESEDNDASENTTLDALAHRVHNLQESVDHLTAMVQSLLAENRQRNSVNEYLGTGTALEEDPNEEDSGQSH
ncbi:hypothetical protein Moror_5518 [Moniliophthora roreri MCA 2997]|uniref:EF-hand domain-containing protein n=1 Tax=Moniliophthora roreri (strain MCA 2997) TaxID=1381753 RepID=V2X5Y8_MONRO|nr:hypothetical protein Moror_5518 [Moniliophthora roreri MCA 2997]